MVMSGYKQAFFLFNLDTDPYEQRNLAEAMPEKLEELHNLYKTWSGEMIPAKWYDPHPENILKEENRRRDTRERAARGQKGK